MTNVTEPKSLHDSETLHRRTVRRYVEKALKEKFDYPTKDELRKRIPVTVTKWDLDSAVKGLESEGKIMIDSHGHIIWIEVSDEKLKALLKSGVELH